MVTARLLDVDPLWSWEPLAFGDDGLPQFDEFGGLWIKLTVCGVTRLGYGDAEGKRGYNATKIAIGDALRNAGMRFGLALDLWTKTDLDANTAHVARKTPADVARDNLLKLCNTNGLDAREIAERFSNDYGMSIVDADVKTIKAFHEVVADELKAGDSNE